MKNDFNGKAGKFLIRDLANDIVDKHFSEDTSLDKLTMQFSKQAGLNKNWTEHLCTAVNKTAMKEYRKRTGDETVEFNVVDYRKLSGEMTKSAGAMECLYGGDVPDFRTGKCVNDLVVGIESLEKNASVDIDFDSLKDGLRKQLGILKEARQRFEFNHCLNKEAGYDKSAELTSEYEDIIRKTVCKLNRAIMEDSLPLALEAQDEFEKMSGLLGSAMSAGIIGMSVPGATAEYKKKKLDPFGLRKKKKLPGQRQQELLQNIRPSKPYIGTGENNEQE